MKTILGLDLGTNSIGWSLIQKDDETHTGKIVGAGSRIIPMPQDELDKFGSGILESKTAERTHFRSIRRIRERSILRRDRLLRVLNLLGFLPGHYASEIDFENRLGQFLPDTEPKIAWRKDSLSNKMNFLFMASFHEMLDDFKKYHPDLIENGKKIPYDWTIYFLRKKALKNKISKEEFAWLILNFNQKRGYYQLRGEDIETENKKLEEYFSLKVSEVFADESGKKKDERWYNIILENGWVYRRSSKFPLYDWKGMQKEFIVTTELNEDGSVKIDKEGKEIRTFKNVSSEEDWIAIKKSTENKILNSKKTIGEYIYESLLNQPEQKINGKLVRVVERDFYKNELKMILEKQCEFHEELNDKNLYGACLNELYEFNEAHKNNIAHRGFVHLFVEDIIFYQRPLKSKKSTITDCKFEVRVFKNENGINRVPLKGVPKSHPLFQEFRLWKTIKTLRIYERENRENGKRMAEVDVTNLFLKNIEDYSNLFIALNSRKEINQKSFLKIFKLKEVAYRWNFPEDKQLPCNETRAQFISRTEKIENFDLAFFNQEIEISLWHLLYSIKDKLELEKALNKFAYKHSLPSGFVEVFKKMPAWKNEYAAYSQKAIKKFLPLMRAGAFWTDKSIDPKTRYRIEKIMDGEFDDTISEKVRQHSISLSKISDFQNLPEWLISYIIYGRHSESSETKKWKTPVEIELLEQHSLRNPIVEKIVNETLKVVKDIWRYYGNSKENFFSEIHIELGREMKNPKAKRDELSKKIRNNENTNLRLKYLLAELFTTNVENVRPHSPMQVEILKIYEEGALTSEEGKVPDDILKISKMAQPGKAELNRYKLWLEQKYRSPYTGEIIPLSKLFTYEFEIEHIIPQARFYDDSFTNKVICESAVNKLKGHKLSYEFIDTEGGRIVELGNGKNATIFTKEEYEKFVKDNYSSIRSKMKRLLMDDIPETFIQRQLNDTRYITRVVKDLMSNLVREDGEMETTSKNVLVTNGAITNKLKHDWGLNDIWNDIIQWRFERLNTITNSNDFGNWTDKSGKRVFQTQVPLKFQKSFSKKRIDHRHHALDAIVIACSSRDHVNFLNNVSALSKEKEDVKEKMRYDLKNKLCQKVYQGDHDKNYNWIFKKPWESFTQDSYKVLKNIIVSFKNNQRVITKTNNHYKHWVKSGSEIKKETTQQGGNKNWAIRKSLHKDTVSGLVKLKLKKTSSLSAALENWEMLVNKALKKQVKSMKDEGLAKKDIIAKFKKDEYKFSNIDISKVEVYYWDVDEYNNGNNAANRVSLNEKFTSEMISYVTDSGIQKVLLKHLEKFNELQGDKIIEHPELAFSPEGITEMNRNITELNNGSSHKPILKVRTYETKGNKFRVGIKGNKKYKFVEADKGTNLYFAIYIDGNGKRSYDSIPLNLIIERQKQGLFPVPEFNVQGNKLLMYLNPNDLVFIPNDKGNNESIHNHNIYKMVSSTGSRSYFVKYEVATSIADKIEFTQLNKMEKTIDDILIKQFCFKLKIDRLGNIVKTEPVNRLINLI